MLKLGASPGTLGLVIISDEGRARGGLGFVIFSVLVINRRLLTEWGKVERGLS